MSRIKPAVILAAALLTAGCAALPTGARVEVEHISHPLAGWPCGPKLEEDALTQVNALAVWRKGNSFVETGLGYKIASQGFYGPALTFTARAGHEFTFDKRR